MVAAPNAEDVSLGFRTFADISRVTFRDLTDEEITDYLRKGESFDKAGAYAIQGEGASLVDHYDGSLDTIIGLPSDAPHQGIPRPRERRGRRMLSDQCWLSLAVA